MAAAKNGYTNGVNGHGSSAATATATSTSPAVPAARFADIPRAVEIPVSSGDIEEAVEVDLEELMDDPTELCTLLENENVAKSYWMTIALAYAKQDKIDHAVDIVTKSLGALTRGGKPDEKLALLSCLCWLLLCQCRAAPRVKPEGQLASEARTKDHYIRQITVTLNDASRISPTYHPLLLARGVLSLIRASLQQRPSERKDTLNQAAKFFTDAFRASAGKNIMAVMGLARTLFSLGKYADALLKYQEVLQAASDMTDPDPRIGIGCCFWQLGHKDEAHLAWKRALELNPRSKIANILLGLFHLDRSARFQTNDIEFQQHYKRAMTEYTQTAWKLDAKYPLTCATFGNYFLLRKSWPTVEKLARQAIEATDVNAIASDGWYLLARKEHYDGDIAKATDYYNRADQARGGDEKGFLPAKFGAAQLRTLAQDYEGAKHRLERIVLQSKTNEAMTLLGLLYAEEVFSNHAGEDKSTELKKAIATLEQVRNSWKDPKKKVIPDSAVLLNLARLYESENPDRALQCLQQVEQMEIDEIPDEDRPQDIEDQTLMIAALRECLPPQLLNNMAAFHYHAERYSQARDLFQSALNSCVKLGDKGAALDTDALVTSISFNLARTYEAEGMLTEAKTVYQGLLDRHPDYIDAHLRLTYIHLREDPSDESAQAVKKLLDSDPTHLEVRALYGWHIHKVKRRTMNPAEDQEQRHYKHSLQDNDKHDRYSLTGMGNIFLQVAREMRRDTDQDKDRRTKTYARAIEFFDKALQLDPRNAYAAQGIAIALAEEKRDHAGAIQIFTKVRESLKDASVFLNLGHSFIEVKQYAKAIENYEQALAKSHNGPNPDPSILACLGRAHLLKGKAEKSLAAMKTSLEHSIQALAAAPEQTHFSFNVAFVQIQIASLVYSLPEAQRTLADVEAAAKGLDEAIESLMTIAKSPNPPFPRNDIEQRANMGKNTMRKQLERAMASQREYETKNAQRLEQARQLRETEIKKRQEAKQKLLDQEEEKKRKIREERERIAEQDRLIREQKLEEEAERKAKEEADMTTDEETGERRKREKRRGGGGGGGGSGGVKSAKSRRKVDSDDDIIDDGSGPSDGEADYRSGAEGADGAAPRRKRKTGKRTKSTTPGTGEDGSDTGEPGEPKKKKRRKLERKGGGGKASSTAKENSKYKSAEMVVDSDSDDEQDATAERAANINNNNDDEDDDEERGNTRDVGDEDMDDGDEEVVMQRTRKKRAVVDEDDDDDDDDRDVSMVDETVPSAGNEDARGE